MSNTFRLSQRPLTTVESELLNIIKEHATVFEELILKAPVSRARDLAITKLEETVMWAVKGITA